ncbi:6-phosphogluconolactonase [Leptospira stimsonii]|uniref:6-phosphogluconolactonase n=1 Tax=Leptospira stimsonii TaxID=2202203 RepID=A0A8B3CQT1_9LEPT|nr:6-phosphogluconolactonase [Leptospira stimsonii]RHX86318.1 6-phosphogluconolactonase [Leptospira stimsonii]
MKTESNFPKIISYPKDQWIESVSKEIQNTILSTIEMKGSCDLMLTGGKTAGLLYKYWKDTASLPIKNIRFWFGDERCVPPDHPESNYGLVIRTLLSDSPGAVIARMEGEDPDMDASALRYEGLLPLQIDVMLLGLGEDGHIASLFPNDEALNSKNRSVLHVVGSKPPKKRITVTPRVIQSSKFIYVLAFGEEKGKVLSKALEDLDDFRSLPVRLTRNGTWMLDEFATKSIRIEK